MKRPPDVPIRRDTLPESVSRPVATPIMPSVVYASASPDALDAQYEGRAEGYTYAREGHPNADILARRIDALEGAEGGVVTGSGMAALSAVLFGLLSAGDHVVGGDQLYGRSLRLLGQDLPRFGIDATFCDVTDAEALRRAITERTRLVLVEVVSNPTLRIADLEGIAAAAAEAGALLVVDNTFATPRGIRPFEWGADIVFHSVTKLLAGHSDVTLGYVAARDPELRARIRDHVVTAGLTPSPFDCWLAERGLFTFDLRYDRAEANAAHLASFLKGRSGVSRVIYPGLPDHPEHARAARLLGGRFGNMLSLELAGGRKAANAFTEAVPELSFAPTLGDVATLVSHPASSSHRALTAEARAAMGISEGFLRISVGIEPIEMLEAEFERGLRAAARASG
ncbi:MAG: aminotransferase class I/II-fold pyridoxal phosphate-dependent enzyme [Alphaproteobacteria bacterium]|nr:MAG: aminotransferase class I/II-fold pyridoxal phosphate-dependent enzyme [Alphaproteobacteria bacterium]